jgi:hypothetical protein
MLPVGRPYFLKRIQILFIEVPKPDAPFLNLCWHIAKELLEYKNGLVAINPTFNKLVIALRTAVENGEGSLDRGYES